MRSCTLLFFCVAVNFLHGQQPDHTALLPKELTTHADAVKRLDEMQVEILALDKMTLRRHQVITVLNARGDRHAQAYAWYDDSRKIRELQASVYNALGQEVEKFKERDFEDVSAVDGATLYTDSRIKYLDYTPVEYPYTLDFSYEISTPNTAAIPSWTFLGDNRMSIEKSRYELRFAEPELRPECLELNMGEMGINRDETDHSIRYEASSIAAVDDENLCPDFDTFMPRIMTRLPVFSYEGYEGQARDWAEMGRWIQANLLSGQDVLPAATQARARSLVNGIEDPMEKARVIYEYVQKNTRYISVQVGIGGMKPISASEVDRVKYGDCKGLSNYTKSLLAAVGVPAYYCHVQAGSEKEDLQEDFADLMQGNHIILAIPDGSEYHWLDCTSPILPFGFLGDFTDDRNVLMVKPDGGEIVHTPAYLNETNFQETTASCALDGSGGLKGKVAIETRGIQYDQHFLLQSRSRDDQVKYYKDYWSYLNNLQLTDFSFDNDRKEVSFKEDVSLSAANYASNSGKLMLFSPNLFNRSDYVPDRYRNRELPFEVSRGFLDEDNFEIRLPEGYAIEAMNPEKNIDSEFGQYRSSLSYDKASHSIHYHRKLMVKHGSYPKEKYEAYRDFRKQVAAADNDQIILAQKGPLNH